MKKIITIFVVAALCLSSAFSKEGGKTSFKDFQKYVKGTIGFSHGLIYPDLEYSSSDKTYAAALNQVSVGSIYYNGFEIIPTFGFDFPDADGKKIGFSLEGSLGFVFGGYSEGIYESKTTIVNPGVMGIMRVTALDKFVPYFGPASRFRYRLSRQKSNTVTAATTSVMVIAQKGRRLKPRLTIRSSRSR